MGNGPRLTRDRVDHWIGHARKTAWGRTCPLRSRVSKRAADLPHASEPGVAMTMCAQRRPRPRPAAPDLYEGTCASRRLSGRDQGPPAGVGGRRPAREAAERRGANGGACRRSTPRRRRPSSSTTRRWPGSTSRPGSNGNIFDFVMATEGLTFPEAVERLAGEAGLPCRAHAREPRRASRQRAGLHEVLEWAAPFFEAGLAGRDGARARAYLAERGPRAGRADASSASAIAPGRAVRAARPSGRQGRVAPRR